MAFVNIHRTDDSPNSRQLDWYILPSERNLRSSRSWLWSGNTKKASFRSIFVDQSTLRKVSFSRCMSSFLNGTCGTRELRAFKLDNWYDASVFLWEKWEEGLSAPGVGFSNFETNYLFFNSISRTKRLRMWSFWYDKWFCSFKNLSRVLLNLRSNAKVSFDGGGGARDQCGIPACAEEWLQTDSAN